MQMDIVMAAGENERFAPTAFESQVGREVPVFIGEQRKPGRVVAARVEQDGCSAVLTVQVDVEVPELERVAPSAHSLSFGAPRGQE